MGETRTVGNNIDTFIGIFLPLFFRVVGAFHLFFDTLSNPLGPLVQALSLILWKKRQKSVKTILEVREEERECVLGT